nr:ABC transporter ATP-binding protein [bacterium]
MIRVTHLSKTYKAKKKRNDTHAIKDMTFTLPNTGMIFIVGKSGSGKSTLLNILGGLDDFDGGSVIVDGNNLGEMSHDDFNRYRSSYVSFIFQDHFLVDDLSLIDNVGISLNVLNMDDYNLTSEALESVDLINKANSLPKELSGGERQRGAVARAIVKKPKLILCDEPTGNLDDYNTKLVFDLLKKLSKESLVVVVSHDLDSANIYADRILEIFDGTILSDEEKNANYSDNLIVTSENIKIPFNRTLSNSDIDLINKNIENKKL